MGKVVNVVLTDTNEQWLREHTHRKGDLSNIINRAIDIRRKDLEQLYDLFVNLRNAYDGGGTNLKTHIRTIQKKFDQTLEEK